MHTAEEFNNLILKEDGNRIVRFSDIGRAELGPADIKSYMKMNGVPMVGIVVIPQPGANHIEIANAVYDRMEKMKKDLPEDIQYNYGFDNTKFIRASINEVKQTVYEAFVLVIIIIFLFLRDWRVTLVPCIVIPVSLIGAFFVMYLAGFSINVLSMLAVVLAVGLVVDDAIVMTENIYVRIEKECLLRRQASREPRKSFCCNLHHHHVGCRVLPHCVHGWHDGTAVPRIQYSSIRFGGYLFICRTDLYPDACHQTPGETRKAKLVLP